ncbi:MAG: cobalt ECF transporter T component CbiQ [Thermoleophilia bacterium]|nr:cobalt ECF transporter T component CbiQ [Thermoleophilia bacterium]
MTGASHGRDDYAWSGGWLSRVDPRVKIASVAGLLAVNLLAATFLVPLVISFAMLLLMVAGRVPYRRQLIMIAFPATFAIFIIASQTVFEGRAVFASLWFIDLHLDGLLHGIYLSLRVVSGALVVVVLGVTTPINRLCMALRWFRVPATFVEVVLLTYRYLFDIYAEYARMREAQRSRLGWTSAAAGLSSSRMLGGSLFLRVYERGLRSAEAMSCRGAGSLVSGNLPRPSRLDVGAGLATALLLVLLVVLALEGWR